MKYLQKILVFIMLFVLAFTSAFPEARLAAFTVSRAEELDDMSEQSKTADTSAPLSEPEPEPEEAPQPEVREEPPVQPIVEESTAPEEKPTEQPSQETEPQPTEETDPMPQPSSEPTVEESETPEPEEERKPLTLSEPHADREVYEYQQQIRWTVQVENAVKAEYQITNSNGVECARGAVPSEELEQGTVTVLFSATTADYYTMTFYASSEKESKQVTAKAAVRSGSLKMTMQTKQRYAFAGETVVKYQVDWKGGLWPYKVSYRVVTGGSVTEQTTLEVERNTSTVIQFVPAVYGDCCVEVTVTDSTGLKAEGRGTIPTAVKEYEPRWRWEASVKKAKLTGDWREDLIAVAKTQIGVKESVRNFIIDKDGQRKGYTRYGDWYGAFYSNWCAMFVCFCLHYANIPKACFPHDANCLEWKEKLQYIGVYEDAAYVPEAGDLVFFRAEGAKIPGHVGIVCNVTDTTICTIEGNTENRVMYKYYSLDHYLIDGYANMRTVMKQSGKLSDPKSLPEANRRPGRADVMIQ